MTRSRMNLFQLQAYDEDNEQDYCLCDGDCDRVFTEDRLTYVKSGEKFCKSCLEKRKEKEVE